MIILAHSLYSSPVYNFRNSLSFLFSIPSIFQTIDTLKICFLFSKNAVAKKTIKRQEQVSKAHFFRYADKCVQFL